MAAPLGLIGQGGLTALGNIQAQQQTMNVAEYNASALRQQANQVSNATASNEAGVIRRSAAEIGDQAAALGQANIGTGGSAAAVEKQSATSARMDALNTWYGGELERHGLLEEAKLQDWQANQIKDKNKPPAWDVMDRITRNSPLGWLTNPVGKATGLDAWSLLTSGGAGDIGKGTGMLFNRPGFNRSVPSTGSGSGTF
jgi:hypothetical protein